jgi:sulfate adenylyltransferase subunit 1
MKISSSLHNDSKRHGTQGEKLDLALLVDGLQAEREQGITIDVAYRYFSTEKRKFIIADTPGMSSTPVTWRPVRPPVSWRSC